MSNISFHALKALEAVYTYGSFQKASSALRITQSAVTQRIHQLEDQVGSMVITRTNPPRLTASGEHLMKFTKQLLSLETELFDALGNGSPSTGKLLIALNYDSMSSWFMSLMMDVLKRKKILVHCILQHEKKTIDALRKGEAEMAISTESKPIIGGESRPLGALRYVCVGTKAMKRKSSSCQSIQQFFKETPTVFFSEDDYVCEQYYRSFAIDAATLPHHLLPSSAELYDLIKSGRCYGLVPEPQARRALRKGTLVQLTPKTEVKVEYYLHYWRQGTQLYKDMVSHILSSAHLGVTLR